MRNFKVTAVCILTIVVCHFGGVFGALFWFGGLLIIPAMVMLFQFHYLTGRPIKKVALAAIPWAAYAISGVIAVRGIEHESTKTMSEIFYLSPLYSALVGSAILVIWIFFYGKFRGRHR